MQHRGGVDVLEAAQDLVDEVLEVVISQGLGGADDLVQVRIHQLIDDVDVIETLLGGRPHDVAHSDDVVVPARQRHRGGRWGMLGGHRWLAVR